MGLGLECVDKNGRWHSDRTSWCQTFSGRQFWPLEPHPDDVSVFDIAHALAYQCRFMGHVREFYSVAQHCVLASQRVTEKNQIYALMHDAAEAYCVDLARPIKRTAQLAGYCEVEKGIHAAICLKLGILPTLEPEVHEADMRMLATEARDLMAPPPASWGLENVAPYYQFITPWSPAAAEACFLDALRVLVVANGLNADVIFEGE